MDRAWLHSAAPTATRYTEHLGQEEEGGRRGKSSKRAVHSIHHGYSLLVNREEEKGDLKQ